MDADAWRSRLAGLLAAGVDAHGHDAVEAALRDELGRLGTSAPVPLLVDAPVIGVAACSTGWVGVLLAPDARPAALASARIAALVELALESADVRVVAIDTAIALPGRGARQADELEVDGWVRARPAVDVVEVRAELSFVRMAGRPLRTRKNAAEGVSERRAVLAQAGLVPPAWFRGAGFEEDDLLDACAAAWTAARHVRGESEALPPEPDVFSDGPPAAIWV